MASSRVAEVRTAIGRSLGTAAFPVLRICKDGFQHEAHPEQAAQRRLLVQNAFTQLREDGLVPGHDHKAMTGDSGHLRATSPPRALLPVTPMEADRGPGSGSDQDRPGTLRWLMPMSRPA